ncbi:hypothetical protein OIY81_2748 [Cryptosporidium canis]|uniref:Uncharacterized protein n=1 Tax=Cryptosporidium canis TaxID=195482 RepID=A0ABQ8P6A3_9CRYT|nr:hypothetical protein OIY81_2748 [Cryptosporidium canis]KAJ1609869.1 hypothetical protein OJ252_2059 [Cryptosporidium canis]
MLMLASRNNILEWKSCKGGCELESGPDGLSFGNLHLGSMAVRAFQCGGAGGVDDPFRFVKLCNVVGQVDSEGKREEDKPPKEVLGRADLVEGHKQDSLAKDSHDTLALSDQRDSG